ncbi:YgaP family membrane protein [Shouchella shacheensis]|uniref:YgaP family membrane protein n=1 Tax=Shouchella shacheensis TaxID=1649580 RepID=UPI00073FE76C|nr:DUF2892 domain-containing protein [Shouchella shacheensis]
MKPNISRINALCRITCGLSLLVCAGARLSRHPKCVLSHLGVMGGAMKTAEGIVRYCPMVALKQQLEEEGAGDQDANVLNPS